MAEKQYMSKRNYLSVVSFIFLVIAVLHALRLLGSWEAVIGGTVIPIWVSWLAVIVAGILSWQGFLLLRSS